MNGLGGCGCKGGIQSVNGIGSPDGLGLFRTTDVIDATWLVDAVLGGAIGYAAAPTADDRAVWSGGGALAGGLAGVWGLLGLAGLGFYLNRK